MLCRFLAYVRLFYIIVSTGALQVVEENLFYPMALSHRPVSTWKLATPTQPIATACGQ